MIFFLFGPYRVKGKYRIPRKGGVLILANHVSDTDPVLVQLACSRPIYFMSKSELFDMRVVGPILRMFRAFPVKRGEPDRAALKLAIALLKAGQAVCVFPEGQLSESGELQELKAGVGLIARQAQVPVICVGIRGTNKILPYGSLVPRPALSWVEAIWGEVHSFDSDTEIETIMAWSQGQLRELTRQETLD